MPEERSGYAAKAEEAERKAAAAPTPELALAWRELATVYRKLAEQERWSGDR